jgi:hypothetical protein
MVNECGAVRGMRIVKRNRSTWRKPAPLPFCPSQIPHDLTLDRTRAAELVLYISGNILLEYFPCIFLNIHHIENDLNKKDYGLLGCDTL